MSIANFFRRPHYTSDITQFLNELKAANPDIARQQRERRALLWDKDIDWELQAEMNAGRVPQKPYVYQTDPTKLD